MNVSSVGAIMPIASSTMTSYGVAKAAQDALTKNLAFEFATKGVRINSVLPGKPAVAASADFLAVLGACEPQCNLLCVEISVSISHHCNAIPAFLHEQLGVACVTSQLMCATWCRCDCAEVCEHNADKHGKLVYDLMAHVAGLSYRELIAC